MSGKEYNTVVYFISYHLKMKWLLLSLLFLFLLSPWYSMELQQLQGEYYDILSEMKTRGIIWQHDIIFLKENTTFKQTTWIALWFVRRPSKKIELQYNTNCPELEPKYNYMMIHELWHYVQQAYNIEYTWEYYTPYCEHFPLWSWARSKECFADSFYYDYLWENTRPYYKELVKKIKSKKKK